MSGAIIPLNNSVGELMSCRGSFAGRVVAGDFSLPAASACFRIRASYAASFAWPGGARSNASRLVQALIEVAPTEADRIPTGTFSSRCSARAKKYAVAEKSPTVCGEQTAHA